ncbi:hypothetical protein TcasGA2_TC004843 [Tribolium castaneum]|uniref:Uncharacterized protein n=1 Tax=Tribolium castaneum TaxID=7070 RepID=D6WB11_TRICA|nr:hypothetical protein TcasGA2_TC004843 [Tribolium castaneum]
MCSHPLPALNHISGIKIGQKAPERLKNMQIYSTGQLVSSAAPHLRLPIIVNLNQRLVFLLMNRSHLNADSPSVGRLRRRRRRYCAPSGQRCISQQKSQQIIATFRHWLSVVNCSLNCGINQRHGASE